MPTGHNAFEFSHTYHSDDLSNYKQLNDYDEKDNHTSDQNPVQHNKFGTHLDNLLLLKDNNLQLSLFLFFAFSSSLNFSRICNM